MSSPVPPELQNQIAIWRQKAQAGTLSMEEMRAAIIALRAGRTSAVYTGPSAKKKAAKSADELLGELGI